MDENIRKEFEARAQQILNTLGPVQPSATLLSTLMMYAYHTGRVSEMEFRGKQSMVEKIFG